MEPSLESFCEVPCRIIGLFKSEGNPFKLKPYLKSMRKEYAVSPTIKRTFSRSSKGMPPSN